MKQLKLTNNIKKGLTPQQAKKIISLALAFILVVGVYILIIKYESLVGTAILYALTTVLLMVCLICNGGFNKDIPTPDMLRDDWSAEKKEKFIRRLKKGKQIAKSLMIWLLPLLCVVMFDIFYLFWITKS